MNLAPKEVSETLHNYMELVGRNGYFNGAVLVAHQGEILLKEGYGMASFEHEIANTPKTKFRIGSITKGFTAMAVMMLEERGLLRVADPLDQYLPDFPNGGKITIHHLLVHASGLFDFTAAPDFWEKDMRLYTPDLKSLVALFRDEPLAFRPGEDWEYSNSNYVLLLAVIEQVTGEKYEDYLQREILDKIGARDTGFDDGRKVVGNLASGYSVFREIIHAEFADMSKTRGGYGMYATVEDLYRWERALHTEDLVSQANLERIMTAHHPHYGGYGWDVGEVVIAGQPRRRIGHFGDLSGFVNDFRRYPDEDLVVIVLSNLGITPVEELGRQLARIALGESVEEPFDRKSIPLPEEELRAYEGTYYDAADKQKRFLVEVGEGKLYVSAPKRYGVWYQYPLVPVRREEGSVGFVSEILAETFVFTGPDLTFQNLFGARVTATRS